MNRSKPSGVTTPAKVVNAYPFRRALMKRGWTARELDASRLFPSGAIAPSRLPPAQDFGLLKAYLVLRALVLNNPPPGLGRGKGWAHIASVLAAALTESGLAYSEHQRQRAEGPRGFLYDGGPTLDQLIERLATKAEHADLKPSELWPNFFAELVEQEVSPVERSDGGKFSIEYDGRANTRKPDVEPKRKTISFGRFSRVVASARKRSREPG